MNYLAPPSGVDVSVVIVSWNAKDYLRVCLRSIDEQSQGLSLEIFVVDNASEDGSVQMVRAEFPHVRVIANQDNRGFAAANNQGMREATGRYVLLLNPDTVILENAIDETVAFAEKHPDAGVIGCQVWETPERIQRTCFRFPGPLNLLLADLGLESAYPASAFFARRRYGDWNRDTEKQVDVVSGMYMLVRREAIDEVGLMDEAYFVYAEEADWCFRFWRAGWECVFTPVAKILHTEGGGKSTEKVAVRMYVQKQKSLQIFHRKNLGVLPWLVCKVIYAVTLVVRLIALSARRVISRGGSQNMKVAMAAAALKYHLFGVDPTRSP